MDRYLFVYTVVILKIKFKGNNRLSYTLFSGCSFTNGDGFDKKKLNPDLWVNILYKNNVKLQTTELLNIAEGGKSNAGIFQNTVWQLTNSPCKYAFVEWSGMPRFELSLGLELYATNVKFTPNANLLDFNLNDASYSGKYLTNISNRLLALVHLHHEILNLVSYVNSLIKLCKLTNTKLFFINGMCPWDNNYFSPKENVLPNDYTDFTKILLTVNNRDDEQIFALYKKIHLEYNQLGGIQEHYWLNLYQSMLDLKQDVNSDNIHPGTKSNQVYAELFNQAITSKM